MGILGAGAVGFIWYYGSPLYTDVGYRPTQPVPFSHKLHAGDLGMDCRYCHSQVEQAAHANIPAPATCMNCHSIILKDSPKLLPIREAVATVKPVQPSVDRSGRPVFGGAGTRPGNMSGPTDIERDSDGNLYVVDARFKRLQKYDRDGNFITSVSVKVNPSDVNEPSEPWGVAVADDGTIVVADTFGWRIRIFERDLTARATFGKPENATGKPGPFDLFGPRDAAFDRQGNIWITDTGHDRIVVYNTTGQYVREFGTEGNAPGQFDEPVGLSMAADGTAFVADMYNGRVVVLDAAGGYQSAFPVDGWGGKGPEDKPYIRALRDGRVAVSLPSLNQVRLYDRQGALKATITGDSEPLSRPYGMVETADGKLWIVESGSQRVRQFALP